MILALGLAFLALRSVQASTELVDSAEGNNAVIAAIAADTGDTPPTGEQHYEVIKTVTATVTAYNTLEAQTDSTPCVSADQTYICGRSDVVACPRWLPFGSIVGINGGRYYCHDRTALKYGDRFDISFDKDVSGALKFGKQIIDVEILYIAD